MPKVEESMEVLREIRELLYKLAIPFSLDGGTLLGFYRDGTFCEDDHDDIDLTTSSRYWTQHKQIIEKAQEIGFEVYKVWDRNEEQKLSGQIAIKKNNVKVDIMFKEIVGEEKKQVFWTVYGGKKGITYKSIPYELAGIFENVFIENFNQELLMPYSVEDYLTYRYGNWKEKVHRSQYSCYTTDKAIVESYEDIISKTKN